MYRFFDLFFYFFVFLFLLIYVVSFPISRKHKVAPLGLAPLKATLEPRRGRALPRGRGQEARQKTPDPPTKEAGTPRPQEPEGTVLALGPIPPLGDASQEGQGLPEQAEEGRAEVALTAVPPERTHEKGPARPEAPTREGGGSMAWGQSLVVWPNHDDPEGRARFVLDDPSQAYLWWGLEECGRASVEAINRESELVSRDMFKFAQVRSSSLLVKCFTSLG